MLPTINGKSLLDCNEADLQFIINNPDFRENEYLDYKCLLSVDKYPRSEAQKRQEAIAELRSDICAFANANGGYLILGIKENGRGEAEELSGIDITDDNTDKFELNLKNYLQPISPRPPAVETRYIKLGTGKYIVIILVKHDFFAPYIHLADEKNYRIYKRVGNSKAVMPYAELKNMFTQSLSLEREVRKYREERMSYFLSQEDNQTYDYSRFFLFHIIPETFLDSNYNNPMLILERRDGSFSSIFLEFGCSGIGQPTIEGLSYHHFRDGDNTECRLYNSGVIECFYPLYPYYLNSGKPDHDFFNAESIWEHIDNTVKAYIKKMSSILHTHRIYACISICGCKNAVTAINEYDKPTGTIDRERLICNPVVFEDIVNEESVDLDKKRLRLEYLLSLGIRTPEKVDVLIKEVYGE